MMKAANRSALLRLLDSKLAFVLNVIIENAQDDGTWISSQQARDQICHRASISSPTMFRYIKLLVSKDILLREGSQDRGCYKLNPQMLEMVK
jgi:predicted HTH transcriptional regulator